MIFLKSNIQKKFRPMFLLFFLAILFLVGCDNSTKSSNIVDNEDVSEWVADEYTVNCVPSPTGKGGDMCFVPEGEFKQGCNEAIDDECLGMEFPFHWKMLESFWIDKYEVTIEDFQKCVDSGVCNNDDEELPHYDEYRIETVYEGEDIYTRCNLNNDEKSGHPMNCVSWFGAKAYCEWIGKRLPTEAEWEKAARGTDGRKYPWGNEDISCEYAVYGQGDNSCEKEETQPVGSKAKGVSPYGCYDMSGNVNEWTNDELNYYRPDDDDVINIAILTFLRNKVYRGGGLLDNKRFLRCSDRVIWKPDQVWIHQGFRCVADTLN